MKAFTVHEKPGEAADRLVFVKDGLSWPALFVPVLWLIWHRLWLALLLYLVYALAVTGIARVVGETPALLIVFLAALLFALEASNIRRWALGRRGFTQIGETFGHNLDEAEIRYFHEHRERAAAPVGRSETPPKRRALPTTYRRKEEDDVVGLFPRAES